jgi:hypothetical protein
MPDREKSKFLDEVNVLQKLLDFGFKQLVAKGSSDSGLFYIILNKFGPNLSSVMDKLKY